MKMPDFDVWADIIICKNSDGLFGQLNDLPKSIELALRQAFEQGYHLGLNKGWAIEQDKEYANKEGGKA